MTFMYGNERGRRLATSNPLIVTFFKESRCAPFAPAFPDFTLSRTATRHAGENRKTDGKGEPTGSASRGERTIVLEPKERDAPVVRYNNQSKKSTRRKESRKEKETLNEENRRKTKGSKEVISTKHSTSCSHPGEDNPSG